MEKSTRSAKQIIFVMVLMFSLLLGALAPFGDGGGNGPSPEPTPTETPTPTPIGMLLTSTSA